MSLKEQIKRIHDSARKSDEGSNVRSLSKEPFGPDVLGLQVGMSASSVEKSLKDKKMAYTEEKRYGFAGETSDGKYSGFYKEESLKYISGGGNEESLKIFFTPGPPGEERLTAVGRTVRYSYSNPPKQGPTPQAFEDALKKKYGSPTMEEKNSNAITYLWIYESDGSLREPTSGNYSKCLIRGGAGPVQGYGVGADIAEHTHENDKLSVIHSEDKFMSSECGSISLVIQRNIETNPTISFYGVLLQGYDEYFASWFNAKERASIFVDKSVKETLRKGNAATPNL